MKKVLSTLVYLLMINSLWAVNKYFVGDILYVIDENVNFRSEPNLNSNVLGKLSKENVVKILQIKYGKGGDISLYNDNTNWKSILTGKWVKIEFNNKVGYVFDAYLSHYNFKEFYNLELCISHDTLTVQDYERYTRTVLLNGVIRENGVGMEWGKEIFMIPDFTFEEAILFRRPNTTDDSNGKFNLKIQIDKIKLEESDGTSWRELEIVKYGEYIIIKDSDGV